MNEPCPSDLTIPRYSSSSIIQVPSLIHGMLGDSSFGPLANVIPQNVRARDFTNVVHFLIDGFGQKQWNDYRDRIFLLKGIELKGNETAIDTVFPSSTPVALNSLYSNGQPPIQHGLVDWWLYNRDIDNIMVTLPFCTMQDNRPDSLKEVLPPETLFEGTTIFEILTSKGVDVKSFISDKYAKSVYSRVTLKGSQIVSHDSAANMMDAISKALTTTDSRKYLYGYWGGIDEIGHAFGPSSDEHEAATYEFFNELTRFVRTLDAETAQKTVVLISADHGQIDVDPAQTMYLNDLEGFDNILATSNQGNKILPWGGTREVFIEAREPKLAYEFLNAHLAETADIIFTDDAIKLGLFGSSKHVHPMLKSRTGNLIILPRNKHLIWYKHPAGTTVTNRGQHGGLSLDEMSIPLAICSADELLQYLSTAVI